MTAAERLKSLADRILKLMADRDEVSSDIKDVFAEVKSGGFDAPVLRKAIAEMRMDPEKRKTMAFNLDAYRLALGIADDASLDEQPRVVAAKMLSEGAGVRETARATGVKKSTVSDMSGKISREKSPDTPAHQPAAPPTDSAGVPSATATSPLAAPAGGPFDPARDMPSFLRRAPAGEGA